MSVSTFATKQLIVSIIAACYVVNNLLPGSGWTARASPTMAHPIHPITMYGFLLYPFRGRQSFTAPYTIYTQNTKNNLRASNCAKVLSKYKFLMLVCPFFGLVHLLSISALDLSFRALEL